MASPSVPSVTVAQSSPQSATITGTVLTAGGAPVAGAHVTASGPASRSADTDANGAFSITVPPGIYRVAVGKGGYQPVSLSDITLVNGTSEPLKVTLTQEDLSSFRTIGTVTASASGRSTINTGPSQSTFITGQAFQDYASPQINDVLQHTGNVVIQKLGTQQDTSIVVGGLQPYETQVLIDGHPISLGQYGVWFSQYFPSFLVGGAEIQTGAGNTTPFANLAVGGTVNITTPPYTTKSKIEGTYGVDNYQSQSYNVLASGAIGGNQQLQYVVGAGYSSQNGPYFHKYECDVSVDPGNPYATPPVFFPGANQPGVTGIIPFCDDFSGSFYNEGLLGKLKYNFSPSTSLEVSFVGSYGGYNPQGSAWGTADGPVTIEACYQLQPLNCGNAAYAGYNGQTINAFTWYPGTQITNQQQLYTAQFRTSLGNDSLLLRPYIASLQPEFYNAADEQNYPAYYGPSPNLPAYNSSQYEPPTSLTATGGQIPLGPNGGLPGGGNNFEGAYQCPPYNPPYQGNPAAVYTLLNSTSNTIVVNPSGQEECFQYPYSTYEIDELWGGTFSYIHPFGDSFLNFTYDYHGGSTFAYFNDLQNVSVPTSTARFSTFSLTGDLRMVKNLGINFGLYQTQWLVSGEQVVGVDTSSGSPVPIIGSLQRSVSRFDPHVALVYRTNPSTSVRLAYGSSETFPFVGDVSGTPACQPFASSAPAYTAGVCTEKTPNLQPEYSSSYNLGADKRFHNGSILSADLSYTTVHNVFEQIATSEIVPTGILGLFVPINAALLKTQLATLKYTYAPRVGFGFNITASADRSIVSGIPLSAYQQGSATLPANNTQICGPGAVTPGSPTCIPYLKGYGQFTYTSKAKTNIALGVDYEGVNNAYYQKPFAIVDFSLRQPLSKQLELTAAIANLLNTNSYQYLPIPNGGVPAVAGTLDGNNNYAQTSFSTTLIPATSRTLTVNLRVHLGD